MTHIHPRAPMYPAGSVETVPMPRATLAPRSTYRGPSGRMDGPEETQYAAELAVLRARSEAPEPRLEPVPEEEPLEPVADRDVLGDAPDRVEGERE